MKNCLIDLLKILGFLGFWILLVFVVQFGFKYVFEREIDKRIDSRIEKLYEKT
jgi:hypothetical protein